MGLTDGSANGLMVGIAGQVGLWLDRIAVVCRTVLSDGTLGSTYDAGGWIGGMGRPTAAPVKRASCDPGWVVRKMEAKYGVFVERLAITCYRWIPGTRRVDYGTARKFGLPDLQWSFSAPPFSCPGWQIGRAVRGKYGLYVDSIRFVCNDWNA